MKKVKRFFVLLWALVRLFVGFIGLLCALAVGKGNEYLRWSNARMRARLSDEEKEKLVRMEESLKQGMLSQRA